MLNGVANNTWSTEKYENIPKRLAVSLCQIIELRVKVNNFPVLYLLHYFAEASSFYSCFESCVKFLLIKVIIDDFFTTSASSSVINIVLDIGRNKPSFYRLGTSFGLNKIIWLLLI